MATQFSRGAVRAPEKGSGAAPRSKLSPGLYVTATPIGNMADITLRALDALRGADVVACEDTRVTGRLLARYGIRKPLVAYHDHNEAQVCPGLIERVRRGEAVVLVADAGSPLVSDPGYRLVSVAREQSLPVAAVPGASSVVAALTVSGLPPSPFLFAGFLPSRRAQRQREIARLGEVAASLVLFESPRRLGASLADLAAGLGPREAAVARELTKLHEEVRRGSLDQLARHYAAAGAPKGEVVVVVAPPARKRRMAAVGAEPDAAAARSDGDIDQALAAKLRIMSPSRAAAALAATTGRPRRDLYARALALGGGRGAR